MISLSGIDIKKLSEEMISNIPSNIQIHRDGRKHKLSNPDVEELLLALLLKGVGVQTEDTTLSIQGDVQLTAILDKSKIKKPKINNGTCAVENCANPASTKGLCMKHYSQMRRGTLKQPYIDNSTECGVSNCNSRVMSRGLCSRHYDQVRNKPEFAEQILAGDRIVRKVRNVKRCTLDGCDEKHKAKGLCVKHYLLSRSKNMKTP